MGCLLWVFDLVITASYSFYLQVPNGSLTAALTGRGLEKSGRAFFELFSTSPFSSSSSSCITLLPTGGELEEPSVWFSNSDVAVSLVQSLEKYKLTLNVRGPSYLGLIRSISWLLMPWLLMSPGHQQPWNWLCRICKSWSYLRKDLKYLCHINVE